MGRRPRIEYVGAIYHIIQRGNNKNYIFNEDYDKGYFIDKLKEAKAAMPFNLFGYVIMDNHYHLLIQTKEIPLSKIMHDLNNKYSKYYNNRTKKIGHVFGGRYKAILVQDERYLLALIRYIHQNPTRAKLCKNVWQYEWSSDYYYRKNAAGFVDINIILDIISGDRI